MMPSWISLHRKPLVHGLNSGAQRVEKGKVAQSKRFGGRAGSDLVTGRMAAAVA